MLPAVPVSLPREDSKASDSSERTVDSPSTTPPPAVLDVASSANGTSPGPKHQTAFVHKLYSMVEDPDVRDVMWSESGTTFLVTSPVEFSKCLHNFFKHNNWQSFVRQLNMYQFHKVSDVFHANAAAGCAGSTCPESTAWEFKHPCFQRGRMDLLASIKRKASRPTSQSRDSYTYQSQAQAREHPVSESAQQPQQQQQQQQQHPRYEQANRGEPYTPEEPRNDQATIALMSRLHGLEESQRMLMDQTNSVFGTLRIYHGVLTGIANVLGSAVPDQNTAAIQSDLQLLSQQLTYSQYAPRRSQTVTSAHNRPTHIAIPPVPRHPYYSTATTPGLTTPSGWSNPGTPVPAGLHSPTYSPHSRHQPPMVETSDSYFRQPVARHPSAASTPQQYQQQHQQQQYQYQPQLVLDRASGVQPTKPNVLTPPLSDSSVSTSTMSNHHHHHHQDKSRMMDNTSNRLAPVDRCRSLQSLLNNETETEDKKRRKVE